MYVPIRLARPPTPLANSPRTDMPLINVVSYFGPIDDAVAVQVVHVTIGRRLHGGRRLSGFQQAIQSPIGNVSNGASASDEPAVNANS